MKRPGYCLVLALACAASHVTAQETEQLYLSGHDKDDAVPWRFMCTSGAQSGYWTNLVVPSQWDMHGFGTLTYKKDATNAWNERGLYQLDFKVPADWADRRTFLVFEGVMTDTSAKLNGQSVGPTHQGGFYRFKYEVTPWLKCGLTNRLEVTVARHSANESVNQAERLADYWVFAGIYRPVYLEAVPKQFIQHVAIDARHNGAFSMDVFVSGTNGADAVEAQIKDLAGEPVGASFQSPLTPSLSPDGGEGVQPSGDSEAAAHLTARIDSPKQWSTETPNLYSVEVRLLRGDEVLHRIHRQFGFRTMEVRDGDGLYVNGHRVVLKGVCRHSFWPDSGRCLSDGVHRLDIETMKDMNMNAVRMSHYPPDAGFLDLCDELGLYVLDELAGWHHHYDDEVGPKLVKEMVTRDVNHPSVLFWDNGNEGGFNTNLDHLFGEYDPQQRRVLHPWAPFSGVNTAHYLAYQTAKIAAAGEPMYYQPKPNDEVVNTNLPNGWIYMPTEFLHGLYDGGAGAGMEDYWRMMTQSPLLGGGFVWTFCDEGVKRPDTGIIDCAGNQAPDGIVGPYRQREGSFYAIKELWSPIQVQRRDDGSLAIQNHYSFTDANQCSFTWQLRTFRKLAEPVSGYVVLNEGKLKVPSIKPGGNASVPLNLPVSSGKADALALQVNDPGGRELWTWVWPLGDLNPFESPSSMGVRTLGEIRVHESQRYIEVHAGALSLRFSKSNGMLEHVQRGARVFSLSNGPRAAHGESVFKSIQSTTEDSSATITTTYEGTLEGVVWHIGDDGWVRCDYRYRASGPLDFYGVAFDYPEARVQSKRWLGNGPYRVWKNRLAGGTLDVWENNYNDTITGYSEWEYPEFKGCFSGVRWLQLETDEGLISILPSKPAYVQVLTPGQPPVRLRGQTSVTLPECGLALLDAIPPIGSKFKPASSTGPQGQLSIGKGEYSGSVRFYFGQLP